MTDTTPIEQFKRDGYLAIECAFNADEVDRIIETVDGWIWYFIFWVLLVWFLNPS